MLALSSAMQNMSMPLPGSHVPFCACHDVHMLQDTSGHQHAFSPVPRAACTAPSATPNMT